jgi:hypothetical protein
MPRRDGARHDRVRLIEQSICRFRGQIDRNPQDFIEQRPILARRGRRGQS